MKAYKLTPRTKPLGFKMRGSFYFTDKDTAERFVVAFDSILKKGTNLTWEAEEIDVWDRAQALKELEKQFKGM